MDVLANHIFTGGHRRVLVGSGSILDAGTVGAMARRLTRVHVEHTGSGSAADVHRFDAAVVQADAVLVRTGVLVFEPGTRADLASTLLPRMQYVVCSTRWLVADFRQWLDGRPTGWDSTVVMVGGCSRTADIEKQLVLGVHGPWNVHLFLVRE
jgi:L-lactate dehydrogenase complex protein LldG